GELLRAPTLLVLEDIDWMDEASRGLIRLLARHAEQHPWFVVLTNRDVDQSVMPEGEDHARVLRLAPLAPDEAQALAAAATEFDPRPVHELAAIAERAGGSPLFLIELLSTDPGHGPLPETIEAAITARIDTLDPTDRTALRCAAVLGLSFPVPLADRILPAWAAGADDPELWARLDEFVLREGHDRVRFAHALVHDVAYEGLPFGQRRHIHAAVAEHLEHETASPADHAELLATHYLRAERYEPALRYAELAGARARAKAATADAAEFYRQALQAAERAGDVAPQRIADVAEALGEVCELAGLYDEGSRGYRIARLHRRADDPVGVARTLRKEGFLQDRAGRYAHARRLYRSGLDVVRGARAAPGMAAIRAELEVACASVLVVEGRYAASIWWAKRAAAHAEPLGALDVLAHAYYLLDWAYSDLGDPAAEQYRELALPIYEQLGDLVGQGNVLNNLGASAYYGGDWDAAVAYYERSRKVREKAGDLVQAATAESNIGEVLCQQGHLDRAEDTFRHSLRVFRGAGYRIGTAWVGGYLGLVIARQGRIGEGRRLVAEARELCRQIGAESLELEAAGRLAEIELLAGNPRAAQSVLKPALQHTQGRAGLLFLEAALERLDAYALAQLGDADQAGRTLRASLGHAEQAGATYEVGLALDGIARLAERGGTDAGAEAVRAAAIFDDLGVMAPPRPPLTAADARIGQVLADEEPQPSEALGR
ncbi:MAG TPA: tetratricopeptide repeat protein, partial [Nitriliruptorales bacterium]